MRVGVTDIAIPLLQKIPSCRLVLIDQEQITVQM